MNDVGPELVFELIWGMLTFWEIHSSCVFGVVAGHQTCVLFLLDTPLGYTRCWYVT